MFFYLGFLSRTFSIHRTAGEWGGHRQTFLTFFVFLVKVSYLPKFHVNIITGSGVMTISFYKGLTRNPEIGNIPVWVLSNIWKLGRVKNTKFGTNVSNKILLKLQNAKVAAVTISELLRENQQRGKITPPPFSPPRLGLKPFQMNGSNLRFIC